LGAGEAIEEPVHLSYPYLLEHEGEIYCVPESAAAREVRLYRGAPFPSRWVRVATLLRDFPAADSTLFEHEGRWWLFCCNAEDGRWSKLFAWYADDLLGPWRPHAQRPLKIDIRSARPGGTPFTHAGALYRPAQDCSRVYGGRVVIQRVLELTPTSFAEEPVRFVEPDPRGPYPHGLHTLSRAGRRTLVDGKRHRFCWQGFVERSRVPLSRLLSGAFGRS